MNKINIISLILLLPIIGSTAMILLNLHPIYNTVFVFTISISAIFIVVLSFFNKSVIEKEIEVIVEKKIYIEKTNKDDDVVIETDKLEEAVTLIDDISESTNVEQYINTQLSKIAKNYNLDQIVFYLKQEQDIFKLVGKYALTTKDNLEFSVGEGLSGQAVKDNKSLYLTDIPEDYITIISGLGKGNPKSLFIVPTRFDNEVIGLAEFASLSEINEANRELIELMLEKMTINIVNVK